MALNCDFCHNNGSTFDVKCKHHQTIHHFCIECFEQFRNTVSQELIPRD